MGGAPVRPRPAAAPGHPARPPGGAARGRGPHPRRARAPSAHRLRAAAGQAPPAGGRGPRARRLHGAQRRRRRLRRSPLRARGRHGQRARFRGALPPARLEPVPLRRSRRGPPRLRGGPAQGAADRGRGHARSAARWRRPASEGRRTASPVWRYERAGRRRHRARRADRGSLGRMARRPRDRRAALHVRLARPRRAAPRCPSSSAAGPTASKPSARGCPTRTAPEWLSTSCGAAATRARAAARCSWRTRSRRWPPPGSARSAWASSPPPPPPKGGPTPVRSGWPTGWARSTGTTTCSRSRTRSRRAGSRATSCTPATPTCPTSRWRSWTRTRPCTSARRSRASSPPYRALRRRASRRETS